MLPATETEASEKSEAFFVLTIFVNIIVAFTSETLAPAGGSKINLIDDCALEVTDVQNEWSEIQPVDYMVGSEKYKGIKG